MRNTRKVCQWPRCVPFSAHTVRENLNLAALECQITKSTKRGINLNIELKRQTIHPNKSTATTVSGETRQNYFFK